MRETRKEKWIRYGLLIFISVLTIFMFTIQFKAFEKTTPTVEEIEIPFLVEVVQEKNENVENPIIAMVREKEGKPVLISYEIKLKNDFQFSTIEALELKSSPIQLRANKSQKGVWVKTSEEWMLFSTDLDLLETTEETPQEDVLNYTFLVEEKENYYLLKVEKEGNLLFQKNLQEKPLSIKRLSEDEDLWIVIFENDVIVLFS